jgi:hypothetical protein
MPTISGELARGVLAAADLRQRLGVSPSTLMRAIQEVREQVVSVGRGRATRYGWREAWPLAETTRLPIFRILDTGVAQPEGELFTLAARQSVWMPRGEVSQGLPLALADARPSGFLGRHFAAMHADLRLPDRLMDWSDHHILLAMSRRGEDLPGHFIIGEESFARWQGLTHPVSTRADYPALADAAIAGHPPGSSAGGERPKFGAFVDDRHVLVKFATRGEGVAQRWCDLLVLEAHALAVVTAHGIDAAQATLVDHDTHYFLESVRFDRVGMRGRRGVLSLAAVQDDPADSWARAAVRLSDAGRVSREDARALRWLDAFGALIANTDRHPYNIVFFDDDGEIRLAPAFDQVSMFYAPTADGQVPTRIFTLPRATADTFDVWDDARAAAREFWGRASDDARVSDAMRRAAAVNARALAS